MEDAEKKVHGPDKLEALRKKRQGLRRNTHPPSGMFAEGLATELPLTDTLDLARYVLDEYPNDEVLLAAYQASMHSSVSATSQAEKDAIAYLENERKRVKNLSTEQLTGSLKLIAERRTNPGNLRINPIVFHAVAEELLSRFPPKK